ncbi:FAD-binding domain-containing protein [Penicillium capsulatum]|uniref:FAD-binding domain-containing protein n=1 Tax=Penicillium capsulatum TaxID=69766 RepID=A0A9W9HQD8_9EURO|nr:FAD-binding domain-containing protein [Penicillium capsulatum]
MKGFRIFSLLGCLALTSEAATVQGVCALTDPALAAMMPFLSSDAAIACKGSPLQAENAQRYWGTQFSKNASVVVYPSNTKDLSLAVKASKESKLGKDFAFVSGGHGQTNASSAYGFVIDLSHMNKTRIISDPSFLDLNVPTLIEYESGSNWLQVQTVTNGTGYTAIGARVASVGVGGFSTGGGIGFLAGAYGYAIDRLRALEVVLMSGEIVIATKTNKYSDLFGRCKVVEFYQEAAPEPKHCAVGQYLVEGSTLKAAQENTVKFFEENKDPLTVVYYGYGLLPADLNSPKKDIANRAILVLMKFSDDSNPAALEYNSTFTPLLDGVKVTGSRVFNVPYSNFGEVFEPSFPYGFRRGFYGPQVTKLSSDYLQDIQDSFDEHIANLKKKDDVIPTALWGIQYTHPTLNGHVPKSANETAWPHHIPGHQTLFSPAYLKAIDDTVVLRDNHKLNEISWKHQAKVGPFVADYPNYMSNDEPAWRIFGDNVQRLIEIKEKYDPDCHIHNGRVFATKACIKGGWADLYPKGQH